MSSLRRFLNFLRRRRLDAEMQAEMRHHLEEQTRRNVQAGMPLAEAVHAAQRRFGNVASLQERAREVRSWLWLEQFGKDLNYAFRSLRRSPSFTVTAVLTLALGIGINAALFTAYNTIALRSLPVKDPQTLVKITGQHDGSGAFGTFSYPEYVAYRDTNQTLSALIAIWPSVVVWGDRETPAPADPMFDVRGAGTVQVTNVSDNYFQVLGAEWALGRGFVPEENRAPGDGDVIVLSHLFWTRRMQGDPGVLGRTVKLRGRTYTVVGVTAEGFTGDQPAPPAGWVPIMNILRAQDLTNRKITPLRLVGRLRPGISTEEATADLSQIAMRLGKEGGDASRRDTVKLESGMRFIGISMEPRMLVAVAPVLFGFAMVLLIACTNVANLLLARGITRQQEIGVRLTLGASRARMVRQLLTENLLLCVLGGIAGVLLATWTLQALKPLVIGFIPAEWAFEARRWVFLEFTPDHRVAIFAGIMALVAAVGAGLLPALQSSRADLISSLKNDGTALGLGRGQVRLRNFLVVAQVAICLMLLSCAGLLVRNMIALSHPQLGFDPEPVIMTTPRMAGPAPMDLQSRDLQMRQAAERLRLVPGVAGAAIAQWGPLLGGPATSLAISHRLGGEPEVKLGRYGFMTEGFVETFGLQLLRGRTFTSDEVMADQRFAVISESAAANFWPGEDPIGQVLSLREDAFDNAVQPARTLRRMFQVIGVVADVQSNLMDQQHVFVYLPRAPRAVANGIFLFRPLSDTPAMLASIKQQAETAGIRLQLDRRLSANVVEQRLPFMGLSALSGLLAALALVMASVGLYGVMAFSVNQRVREIGIRAALGATAENIVGMFVRQGFRLIARGVVIGLGCGLAFALLLPRVLFGAFGAFDPLTFAVVALVFSSVAMIACWLPARRAAKVDPMVALRAE